MFQKKSGNVWYRIIVKFYYSRSLDGIFSNEWTFILLDQKQKIKLLWIVKGKLSDWLTIWYVWVLCHQTITCWCVVGKCCSVVLMTFQLSVCTNVVICQRLYITVEVLNILYITLWHTFVIFVNDFYTILKVKLIQITLTLIILRCKQYITKTHTHTHTHSVWWCSG